MNSIVTRRRSMLHGGGTNVTYLYNEGDECTSVTGGWSGSTSQGRATFNTINYIDLSKYSNVHIIYSQIDTNSANSADLISQSGISESLTHFVGGSSSKQELIVPIVMGSFRVRINAYVSLGVSSGNYAQKTSDHLYLYAHSASKSTTLNIYQVWLE